jgi:hypothetical protein
MSDMKPEESGKPDAMEKMGHKGMMRECMNMHMDREHCKNKQMKKCKEMMGKEECMNMMKDYESDKKPELKK